MFERILNRFAAFGCEGAEILSADELAAWPQAEVAALKRLNLVKKAAPAKIIECPGCEEACLMPVNVYPAQDGRLARIFIACDKREDTGRILIDPAALEQWQVCYDLLWGFLTQELGTSGAFEYCNCCELMSFGKCYYNDLPCEFLLIDLNSDTDKINRHTDRSTSYQEIFLCIDGLPPTATLQKAIFIRLSELLSFKETSLLFDHAILSRRILAAQKNKIPEYMFREYPTKTWGFSFGGETCHPLSSMKGFLYIQYLLQHENDAFSAIELRDFFSSSAKDENVQKLPGHFLDEGLHEFDLEDKEDLPDEDIKEEHLVKLKKLYRNLEVSRETGNKTEEKRLLFIIEKEMAVLEQPKATFRKKAPEKKDNKKARQSVRLAINNAIEEIQLHISALGKFLDKQITRGKTNKYTSSKQIDWHF